MPLRLLPEPAVLGTLDEARAARLLEERTQHLARRRTAPDRPTVSPVLLLTVGGETFGVDLHRVAEVLPAEPPTPLPGSPPVILGLRSRAGRLHAVLDLAALLGLAPGGRDAGSGGHDVLLRPDPRSANGTRRFALRVDRALAAQAPLPLPPDRTPASPGGAVAFHAMIPAEAGAGAETVLAVLDLDRLLQGFAPAPSPPPPAPGA
ncbi:chemotaxis protein CheW [Roseomonas xinghualingensis]|uniref:chemotaxis protein CheW n=1 Tax=Roseomonas xinghualingensis TaxID=2986475 RepID=UPI0021F0D131|nr:chemotaxis protein CheW [Roseomonas sp. SXEYE001]MCV4208787.1 chemotaxis protein CheW [Roseomonas sp. SXEYE001]